MSSDKQLHPEPTRRDIIKNLWSDLEIASHRGPIMPADTNDYVYHAGYLAGIAAAIDTVRNLKDPTTDA